MTTSKIENSAVQLASASNVRNIWGGIIINVKSYGAIGDGIQDDTIAIQRAINYAISTGQTEITMPAGTYLYGTLTNSSGITFIGNGVTLNGTTALTLTSISTLNGTIGGLQGGLALKANQTALDETNAIVATKAAITYVDAQIAAVGNGSPKGVYATLVALQTAFPTGTTGIYIVTANGNWYYWNGSAWTAGGVYQSTGLANGSVTFPKLDASVSDLVKNASIKTNVYNEVTRGGGPFNGGIFEGFTIRIPTGQSGNGSFMSYNFSFTEYNRVFRLVGRAIRVEFFIEYVNYATLSSVNYNMHVVKDTLAQVSNVGTNLTVTQVGTSTYKYSMDYTVIIGDTTLLPYIQVGSSVVPADVTATMTEITYTLLEDDSVIGGYNTANLEEYLMKSEIEKINNEIIISVKADGTGDYTTIPAALATIIDASAIKPYNIIVYPGVYTDINWNMKNYVNIIGMDRETCILKGELPASSLDAAITDSSTFWFNTTGRIANLTITAKNMRYPIHSDSGGQIHDRVQIIENCHIEHFGNQEVIDYRNANGGNPATVWASCHAWGCGTSSGMQIKAYDSTFKSTISAFYYHTNANFTKPCIVELHRCKCIAPNGYAVAVQALGSGTNDRLILVDNELCGYMNYNDLPWSATDLVRQVYRHAEIGITGSGNTPVFFNIITEAKALRITSNSVTSNSKVRVSGTALPYLFGDSVYVDGSGGIQGYIRSSFDVSGYPIGALSNIIITKLGQRLGNRTSAPVTLTVTVDGGTPVNIVFNTDYTAATNATILGLINTGLGASATADAYNFDDRYTPDFADEMGYYRNSTTVGILSGMAVINSTSYLDIRKMTNADDATDFIGIAVEDIRPGETGKVKVKGILKDANFLQSVYTAAAFGTSYEVSSTAGKLVAGSTRTILKGVGGSVVKLVKSY